MTAHGVAGRILVIKLGALGDFVLALGPFAAIRAHHPGARITLLTTAPFVALARASPYFDEVWIDERPGAWQVWKLGTLAKRLRAGRFDRVYDLQTSDRSTWYFRLFKAPKPEWSGIARGCSHPHANPERDRMHTIERQREQLALAGVTEVPAADLSWVKADITRFRLAPPFALLVPGGAAHRPEKRWPPSHYAELGRRLARQGMRPALTGAAGERPVLAEIAAQCPEAYDLGGQTELADIVALARAARFAIGNDTGPMHLIGAAGCSSLVLFSGASDPVLTAPRGPRVAVARREPLALLAVAEVEAALASLLAAGAEPAAGRARP